MIVQLKTNRKLRKMNIAEKMGLYDNFYAMAKEYFLLGYISEEEKCDIEKAARMLERAHQDG